LPQQCPHGKLGTPKQTVTSVRISHLLDLTIVWSHLQIQTLSVNWTCIYIHRGKYSICVHMLYLPRCTYSAVLPILNIKIRSGVIILLTLQFLEHCLPRHFAFYWETVRLCTYQLFRRIHWIYWSFYSGPTNSHTPEVIVSLTNTSLSWAPEGNRRPRRPHKTRRRALWKILKQRTILSGREASVTVADHETSCGRGGAVHPPCKDAVYCIQSLHAV